MGRFINADGLVSTGTSLLGHNMYTYCDNNPIMNIDPSGELLEWLLAIPGVRETVLVGLVLYGGYVAGQAIGDALSKVDWSLPKSDTKTKDETKVRPIPIVPTNPKPPKNDVVFPENPYTFNPKGLIRQPLPGTKNGAIINWTNMTGQVIFRWDENSKFPNGSHYHVKGLDDIHFYPGMNVPEPWVSTYFR